VLFVRVARFPVCFDWPAPSSFASLVVIINHYPKTLVVVETEHNVLGGICSSGRNLIWIPGQLVY
jgi:hypothetical protein